MIVTLTPNPSIDRTVLVENLLPGEGWTGAPEAAGGEAVVTVPG